MSEFTTKAEIKQPSDPAPSTGPLSPDQMWPTAIMFIIAAAGGLISFYRKWKEGNVRAFNFTELLGELVVSGLCGVFAYWLFRGLGVNEWLTAAGVGIVGHMGSRFMFLAERTMGDLADKWSGAKKPPGT
jgi:hypothetical protein